MLAERADTGQGVPLRAGRPALAGRRLRKDAGCMKANDALARWFYRGGRPNRTAAALNRMWATLSSAGLWPTRMATLEVRGRRSGQLRSFPVALTAWDGEQYVVAMLGEGTNWVANVRAAGGEAILGHGRREPVRLEEVAAAERAPIIRQYLQVAPGGRPHIPVDRRAPLAAFEQIAGKYPVFRVRARAGSVAPAR
jgi:deazaflavin-dependent oxidoreductase (nitroreductase family)